MRVTPLSAWPTRWESLPYPRTSPLYLSISALLFTAVSKSKWDIASVPWYFPTFSSCHEVLPSRSLVDLITGLWSTKAWGDSTLLAICKSVNHRYRGDQWKEWVIRSPGKGVLEEWTELLSQSKGYSLLHLWKIKSFSFRDPNETGLLRPKSFPHQSIKGLLNSVFCEVLILPSSILSASSQWGFSSGCFIQDSNLCQCFPALF